MMTISEQKKELRKEIKIQKAHLNDSQKQQAAKQVLDGLLRIPQIKSTHNIAIYNSLPDELPTQGIIEELIKQGHSIYLPVITGQDITFRKYDTIADMTAEPCYGIKEPTNGQLLPFNKPFVIVVPGIAFTTDGIRMGRGGGYYDRFFESCTNNKITPYKIGICFKCQICDHIPTEPFDIRMDKILYA